VQGKKIELYKPAAPPPNYSEPKAGSYAEPLLYLAFVGATAGKSRGLRKKKRKDSARAVAESPITRMDGMCGDEHASEKARAGP